METEKILKCKNVFYEYFTGLTNRLLAPTSTASLTEETPEKTGTLIYF